MGSLLAFIISRYLISSHVRELTKDKKIVRALQKAINHNGVKILILIRMTPIVPYNLLNYLLGISEVKMSQYVLANLGLIPGIVIQVLIGTTLSSIKDSVSEEEEDKTMKIVSIVSSVVASLLGAIGIFCIARKIRLILKEEQAKAEAD